MDTSNYYPGRDGRIDAIEAGQTESLWVSELLGRPIVKAWNAIGSDSFAKKGKPAGSPDRIAIPVAADGDRDRKVGMALVEDTGFDAFDAGTLAESWRQQPGAPRQGRQGPLDARAKGGSLCDPSPGDRSYRQEQDTPFQFVALDALRHQKQILNASANGGAVRHDDDARHLISATYSLISVVWDCVHVVGHQDAIVRGCPSKDRGVVRSSEPDILHTRDIQRCALPQDGANNVVVEVLVCEEPHVSSQGARRLRASSLSRMSTEECCSSTSSRTARASASRCIKYASIAARFHR